MAFDFLRSQDATLFCAQDPRAPLQIGAVAVFEGAPLRDDDHRLRIDAVRAQVESRLGIVPRFRQCLVPVPFQTGPPVWVDDADFDVARHVRLAALPRPGDDAQLREFVARLLEQPLDLAHPLWELWVVEGLAGDRVAVIPKVSHVMADGMALLEFALSVLDADPRTEPERPPVVLPSQGPSALELLVASVGERARRQLAMVGGLAGVLGRPRQVLQGAAGAARKGLPRLDLAPGLPVTSAVGSHRGVMWLRLPMPELLAAKRAHDVSLNDVVLSIVAGGMRSYLARTGEPVDDLHPRVLVPVSTHVRVGEELENRFSMMVADLRVAIEDPVERLRAIHDEMVEHKAAHQASRASLLFGAADLVPVRLLRALGPVILRHQPLVNLAVTNLPGTDEPLYLLGARMLELYPLITVTGNIAVIIGVISYDHWLGVSITVDADVVGDVEQLADDLRTSALTFVDGHDPVAAAGS